MDGLKEKLRDKPKPFGGSISEGYPEASEAFFGAGKIRIGGSFASTPGRGVSFLVVSPLG